MEQHFVDGATVDDHEAHGRPDLNAAELEAGRLLFAGRTEFVAGVTSPDSFPPLEMTEIAFAGRSNVGKSSLVNALVGQNALARVSRTPGRTQQLNFFRIGGKLMLVDLPGYGYASAGRSTARAWGALIQHYFRVRPTLRRVLLLLDSRHKPKVSDLAAMDILDAAAMSYQLVLTKADVLTPAELEAACDAAREAVARRPACFPELVVTSRRTGQGIPELRALLARLAAEGAIR
jgi:GTP-binding protein